MRKKVNSILMIAILAFVSIIIVSCRKPVDEPVLFTVTFDLDNGSSNVTQKVEEGLKVSRPTTDPTKTGFEFDDWYLGATKYNFDTPVTANITILAKYTEIVDNTEYTVTFDAVGGTAVADQTIVLGNKAQKPNAPAKADFTFEDWMRDGEVFNFDTIVTENIHLVAKYNYIGIPDSPANDGRVFNPDFDQLINNFTSTTLLSELFENAWIDEDQPYVTVGYSGIIGNNPDGALWKQGGSENASSSAFQYIVLRLRGKAGASIGDLSIGFRYDDNHEVLVVPFTETLDPDQTPNTRELDGEWHNYVIGILDTLDGKQYIGKTGQPNVDAGGLLVGIHLMNTSGIGSGILEIQDVYFSKVPNPIYPYEGSDYSANRDYWHEIIGQRVSTYVTIGEDGFYGEYLNEGVSIENTHLVLRVKKVGTQAGEMDYSLQMIAPIFTDGEVGAPVALSEIEGLSDYGSSWVNLTIPFSEIYEGDKTIAGYKFINESSVPVAISQSFLSYLGDYTAVDYPLLDFENVLVYDNFNRATIGTTSVYSTDNEVALANGFSYLISYHGLQASTIGDGYITFDSTGSDYVDYVVHSESKANQNEYRYLVFKYKLNDGGTLDDLRMIQKTYGDIPLESTVFANQFVAGLGLPSIPEDMGSYPYKDGEWTYLIVDLHLTEGLSTDFAGFTLFYTGSSISFDAIFFANSVKAYDEATRFEWATFEGLELGNAQDKISDNQWWANVYDSPTTIVADGETNQALQLDGTGYAQYHTAFKQTGRYLAFDLKVTQVGEFVSFRVGPTGNPNWAKDGDLILANGTPMVVNTDGAWHSYVIDWVASGFDLTDTIGFHASNGEIYRLDNLALYSEYPYFDEELVWGTWEWATVGNADSQPGPNQYWMNNYGTNSSIIDVEGNKLLKLDATEGYAQIYTGVMAVPKYVAFDITVEAAGSFGINANAVTKWNAEIIGLDGNPIVLPNVGETKHVVVDILLSGLVQSDNFGFGANDGGIFLIDNVSFQWLDESLDRHPVLTEDFTETPSGEAYWWGNWEPVVDGNINLVTAEYTTVRFGSPLIAGANFVSFDVKLATGNNDDTFRIEFGDGNIIDYSVLVAAGHAPELTEEFKTVLIDLSEYVDNLSSLQVFGFHINNGGVVIDNLEFSLNHYTYNMRQFSDENL